MFINTPAHKHIMKTVADHIGIEQAAVEEFVLDSERVSIKKPGPSYYLKDC